MSRYHVLRVDEEDYERRLQTIKNSVISGVISLDESQTYFDIAKKNRFMKEEWLAKILSILRTSVPDDPKDWRLVNVTRQLSMDLPEGREVIEAELCEQGAASSDIIWVGAPNQFNSLIGPLFHGKVLLVRSGRATVWARLQGYHVEEIA